MASPDIWSSLPAGPTEHKLPSVLLPVGSVWYRADRQGAKSPSTEVPAFFTTKELLAPYKKPFPGKPNLGDATVSTYTVTKEAKLFHMTLNSIIALFQNPALTKEEKELVAHWFQLPEESPPYIFPAFTRPENLGGEFPNYANRRMAALLCRLGFDGWIVKPFNPEKKEGVLQVSVGKVKQIQDSIPQLKAVPLMDLVHHMAEKAPDAVLVPYSAEIMLCKWDSIMNRTAGGTRKTRKTRKSTRRRQ